MIQILDRYRFYTIYSDQPSCFEHASDPEMVCENAEGRVAAIDNLKKSFSYAFPVRLCDFVDLQQNNFLSAFCLMLRCLTAAYKLNISAVYIPINSGVIDRNL